MRRSSSVAGRGKDDFVVQELRLKATRNTYAAIQQPTKIITTIHPHILSVFAYGNSKGFLHSAILICDFGNAMECKESGLGFFHVWDQKSMHEVQSPMINSADCRVLLLLSRPF